MISTNGLVSAALALLFAAQPALSRPLPHHTQAVPERRDARLDVHAHDAVNIVVPNQVSSVSTSTTTITTFITRTTYIPSTATATTTTTVPVTATTTPPSAPNIPSSLPSVPHVSLQQNGQIGYAAAGSQHRKNIRQDPSRIINMTLPQPTRSPAAVQVPDAAKFSVKQVRNPRFEGTGNQPKARDGLQAMAHVYAKFGVALTPELERALRAAKRPGNWNAGRKPLEPGSVWKRGNPTGSVLAVPPNGFDQEYISPVQIGTPPQTVFLALDTGSADLWTLSSTTPSHQLLPQHRTYSPQNSTTSIHVPSESWRVLYGDGSAAQGTTYLDRVSLSANLSVARQPVGAATAVSAEFTSDPFLSGILGLGFNKGSALRPYRMPTFMENLAPQLERPVFAADLRAASPGRFSFGGVDPDGYTGRITWEKVSAESPYWLFNVRASRVTVTVTAGGSNETKTKTKTKTVRHAGKAGVLRAIADTGTSLVMLPRQMVDEYYAAVPGARYDEKWAGVLVPCRARLPDWSFFVGEGEGEGEQESEQHVGTVPGRYINFGPVNGTHCFGGIQSADGFGFAVFGDVLLKAQYVVFDVGNMRIVFANKELRT